MNFFYNQAGVLFHNGSGIYHVYRIIKWDPLPGGLISSDHPWATGIVPNTSEYIWPKNILYASPLSAAVKEAMPGKNKDSIDKDIVSVVGKFLAQKTHSSARADGYPQGQPEWSIRKNTDGSYQVTRTRRMPHGINYIHGEVNYNGTWLIFNDARDGISHFSDPDFLQELKKFASQEHRETTILFRDKFMGITPEMVHSSYPELPPDDNSSSNFRRKRDVLAARSLAFFTTEVRSRHYWFGNPQGPFHRTPLWGRRVPYPSMNLINGSWIENVDRTLRISNEVERNRKLIRPPLIQGIYFQGSYKRGDADGASFLSKSLAYLTYLRIKPSQHNYFFSKKEELTVPPEEIRLECKKLNQEAGFPESKC